MTIVQKLSAGFLIVSLTAAQALAEVQCNEHGAVVMVDSGDVYYLGTSCDAAKKGGGIGRWWLTASALAVEINGAVEALIQFDVNCDLPACLPG